MLAALAIAIAITHVRCAGTRAFCAGSRVHAHGHQHVLARSMPQTLIHYFSLARSTQALVLPAASLLGVRGFLGFGAMPQPPASDAGSDWAIMSEGGGLYTPGRCNIVQVNV